MCLASVLTCNFCSGLFFFFLAGEYADRIDNAPELLENFIEHFDDENPSVQLQLLTAIVKLFLKRPEDAKELVGQVLNLATSNADNPDLRDRGYVYWRLLSTDPEAAQAVVLAAKPVISDDTFQLEPAVLDMLISNISTLASIYHKPPEFFVKDHKSISLKNKAASSAGAKKGAKKSGDSSSSDSSSSDEEESGGEEPSAPDDAEDSEDDSSDDDDAPKKAKAAPAAASSSSASSSAPKPAASSGPIDLFGLDLLGGGAPAPAPQRAAAAPAAAAASSASFDAGFGDFGAPSPSKKEEPLRVVLDPSAGKGLQIRTRVIRKNGAPTLEMSFDNQSGQVLSQFAMKFNDNFIGLAPPAGPVQVGAIVPGQSKSHVLSLTDGKIGNTQLPGVIQVAIKTELGVFYFNQPFPVAAAFAENGKLADQEFLGLWKSLPDTNECTQSLSSRSAQTVDDIKAVLGGSNIFYIAARTVNKATNSQAIYFSAKCKGQTLLFEVKIEGNSTQLCVKAQDTTYAALALQAVAQLLQ